MLRILHVMLRSFVVLTWTHGEIECVVACDIKEYYKVIIAIMTKTINDVDDVMHVSV